MVGTVVFVVNGDVVVVAVLMVNISCFRGGNDN